MMLLSYTMVDFQLYYDGAVDIQIWALLTRGPIDLYAIKMHGFWEKLCIYLPITDINNDLLKI